MNKLISNINLRFIPNKQIQIISMKLRKLSRLQVIIFPLLCIIVLILALRGLPGNPTAEALNTKYWEDNGPFELSPERGRFALAYSLAEDHSFFFSNDIGKFAIPDVGISKGKYVSLFAPLVSFIAIPGYVIGKYFGMSQVGAFAVISIFALLNVILLRLIAIRLGANSVASTIGSIIFIFATPAFAYAVNLYQHHISTLLILLSIYVLLKSEKVWSILIVFFLCALAIPLDYPNLFFMFPMGVFALGRIISFKNVKNSLSVKLNILKVLTPLIMIIPILFFLWTNQVSYGNPFQLSGTLPTAKHILDNPSAKENTSTQLQALTNISNSNVKKSAIGFFQTRDILNGFYIHFASPDRGVIFYAPVLLFGIFGFFLASRKKVQMMSLLAALIGANVLLYSMWGDPWGGWAFGSRYLIPTYAILSIFIALLLTYWRKKTWFLAIFIIVAYYSLAVNTLGAITTSAIPPQVEVLQLEKVSGIVQRYTYQKNWEFLLSGQSKSFAYLTYFKNYISAVQYYAILTGSLFIAVGGLMLNFVLTKNKKGEGND